MTAALIVPFAFEGNRVRVLNINGTPWFIAKDIAAILGYTNTKRAIRQHCPSRCPLGGHGTFPHLQPSTMIIPEGDLYKLVMRSHLPSAERFTAWVTDEVLPSVLRTGSYSLPQAQPQPSAVTNPERAAREILADPRELQKLLLDMTQQHIALQEAHAVVAERVTELEPKGQALDRISTSQGSLCITDAAKTLQVKPSRMFTYLNENGWIYRRPFTHKWVAYQQKIIDGDLIHKISTLTTADGIEKIFEQVLVTPQGLAKLARMLESTAQAGVQTSLKLVS